MATKTERWVCTLLGAGINIWAGYEKAKANNEKYTLGKVLLRGALGAGGGLVVAEVFGEPNDTVNYIGYDGRKRMYDGIAYENRIDSRIAEHARNGKKFSRVTYDNTKPRSEARILEQKRILRYRPVYNIQHNCN